VIRLAAVTAAMVANQSLSYMAVLVLPVAAPTLARTLGLDPGWVGSYSSLIFAFAMIAAVSSGAFIERFGPVRWSQIEIAIIVSGLGLAVTGDLTFLILSGALIGLGFGGSTPASAQILSQITPPRLAPLLFSIKQTGIPIAGILAGLLVPFFVNRFGWQGGFLGAAVLCLVLATAMQTMRASFDSGRKPGHPIVPGEVAGVLGRILRHRELRDLGFASFVYVAPQIIFGSYFTLYLVDGLGYSLAAAGLAFSVSQMIAVPARIFWGWVAGRWASCRVVLAWLGIGMAAASVALGAVDGGWPAWLIIIVGGAVSATAVGWHGVLYAEVARLAPGGKVGATTGGMLVFTGIGQVIAPAAYGALLATSGSYSLGFYILAFPTMAMGLYLFRPAAGRAAA